MDRPATTGRRHMRTQSSVVACERTESSSACNMPPTVTLGRPIMQPSATFDTRRSQPFETQS